jgi:hypothetical protein
LYKLRTFLFTILFTSLFFSLFQIVYASAPINHNSSFEIGETATNAVSALTDYKYLIVVPNAWVDAIKPLAEWKTRKGVPAYIATVESIDSSYAGRDLAWKIREFIKDCYRKWETRYVLLAGDVGYIPTRYIHNPDTAEGDPLLPFFDGTYKPTDWYYAGLDGTWDDDNDGIYGESVEFSTKDEIDWNPEVAVGRLPANSFSELQTMVNKIINYEKTPSTLDQNWFENAILCGAPVKLDGGYWQNFGVMVKENVGEMLPQQTKTLKFYHDTVVNNISKSTLREGINNGAFMVNVAAHGSPRAFYDVEWWTWILPDPILGAGDVPGLTNCGKPSFIFAFSCLTATFDIETAGAWWYKALWKTSLAEELLKHPTGGAIAYVGWARVTWTDEQTEYRFWSEFFNRETGNFRPGLALLYAKRKWNPSSIQWVRKVHTSWHLLGDPETPIWTAKPKYLYVTYPSKVWVGKTYNIETVPNATICIFDKQRNFYNVVTADKNGKATVTVPKYETKLSLVITAQNYFPKELYDCITVEDYVIIDKATVTDFRCDVGTTQTIAFHAIWAGNNSNVIGGHIYVNGTAYITNGTGWAVLKVTYNTIGKRFWTITGVSCSGRSSFEKTTSDPYIIWDRVKIDLKTEDNRIDVGSDVSYTFSASYEYDGHDATPFIKVALNDTLTKTNVGKYYYTVSSIIDTKYGLTKFVSNTFYVIFDKVAIKISAVHDRVYIGYSAPISWIGTYQFDGTPFLGEVTFNDTLTKATVGRFGYKISSISDPLYGITVFDTNEVYCIFDRAITRVEIETAIPGFVKVRTLLLSEYDRAPITNAKTIVNGFQATEVKEGIYEITLSTWNPVLEINIYAERGEYKLFETISTSYNVGNILLEAITPIATLLFALYIIKKHKRKD